MLRPKTETYTVRVPDYREEVRVRRVPVTTYRTVNEVVTERVPVTVRVDVPCKTLVTVPVCSY